MSLTKIINAKYKNNSLGHFYILEPSREAQSNQKLELWICNLLERTLDISQLNNHEDVLIINHQKDKSKYVLDDFQSMFNFLNYKATRATRKFIIINDAQKLSTNVSNKLLKTLEEPPVETTIFLLNSKKTLLMPTINSRAIKLRVDFGATAHNLEDFLVEWEDLKQKEIHELIEYFKNKTDKENIFIQNLITWCSRRSCNYQTVGKLLELMQEKEIDTTFHNAPTHRLFKLALIIKELSVNI